jgi:hypothetical protein
MVKISFTVLGGGRHDTMYNEWSLRPSASGFDSYYAKHKKDFVVGYIFTVDGITMQVKKIEDKSKPRVVFSG